MRVTIFAEGVKSAHQIKYSFTHRLTGHAVNKCTSKFLHHIKKWAAVPIDEVIV